MCTELKGKPSLHVEPLNEPFLCRCYRQWLWKIAKLCGLCHQIHLNEILLLTYMYTVNRPFISLNEINFWIFKTVSGNCFASCSRPVVTSFSRAVSVFFFSEANETELQAFKSYTEINLAYQELRSGLHLDVNLNRK